MSDRPPLIELTGVGKTYPGGTRALVDVDVAIEHGEFTAIVGPSGSGKSTLLNVIGLLDRPTAGSMKVDGRVVDDLPEDELTQLRGRTLGFVFQFHHLLLEFTAAENVMMPLAVDRGRFEPSHRARAIELLGAVGLAELVSSRAAKISGGQQQRVAVARALALDPPLVLADEPTGNLDTASSEEVFALLRRFNRERGTTFIIVTHDERIAARCDSVIRIVDGRATRVRD